MRTLTSRVIFAPVKRRVNRLTKMVDVRITMNFEYRRVVKYNNQNVYHLEHNKGEVGMIFKPTFERFQLIFGGFL